jgi:hypothetical protein
VGAAGSGPLSYQWSFNGTPIPGATLPVLSLTNVGNAHVGDYTVLVSNATDSVNSQVAALFLLGAPVISQDPEATTAYEGQSATFSVSADGSGLRYQWMLNGSPISGATESSYTTPMLVSANSGAVYSVAVYNGAGLVTSAPAVLSVQVNVIPTVTQQPANVTIQPDQRASLCVAFSGTLPLTLHLQRWNGSSWASVLDILATSNDPNCFFTPVIPLADSGAQFRFAADNPAGQVVTNTVTVTVTAPLTLFTTLASRTSTGATPNNRSYDPSISADGTVVAFRSEGTNLVPGFTTGYGHGFARNLLTGVTVAVDQLPDGTEPVNYGVTEMKLAAGGRYVVFASLAPGLVAGDNNNSQDVFLRDLQTGTTKQLTLFPNGSELADAGNGNSEMHLDISADGHYVIFSSRYDFTQSQDVQVPVMALFLRDTWRNETRMLVSHPTDGFGYTALASGGDYLAYSMAHFSPDSETVYVMDLEIMRSTAIFTLDRSVVDPLVPETLTIASTGSVGSGIGMGNATSNFPKLSDDGRYVLYRTNSTNLTNNLGSPLDWAVMVRDMQTQATTVAVRRANGTPVRSVVTAYNSHAISGDGSVVASTTDQTDMGDGTMEYQVYVNPRP